MKPVEDEEWRGSGKVLLAEDEEIVSALTQRMLEHLGFEVIVARDGKEAVDLFMANKDKLKFVMVDLTMPHKNGMEVCKEIRAVSASLPLILTSGYPEEECSEQMKLLKVSGYLQKPFRYESLKSLVKKILSG